MADQNWLIFFFQEIIINSDRDSEYFIKWYVRKWKGKKIKGEEERRYMNLCILEKYNH
jgi:hypothetical protein